jgi:hypothetical protein
VRPPVQTFIQRAVLASIPMDGKTGVVTISIIPLAVEPAFLSLAGMSELPDKSGGYDDALGQGDGLSIRP